MILRKAGRTAPRRACLALAIATALLLPLGGTALGDRDKAVPSISNGVNSGPVESFSDAPGTASNKKLPHMAELDPVTYSLEDAVVEGVEVASRNGIDHIWVDIIRPNTPGGVVVPTIMVVSPYYNTLGRGGFCKTPTTSASTPTGTPGLGCSKHTAFPESTTTTSSRVATPSLSWTCGARATQAAA